MAEQLEEILEGVLDFHSETGTEGGYWAFQDSRFITENTTRYHCEVCGLYWDKKTNPEAPPLIKRVSDDIFPELCPPGSHKFKLTSKYNWSYEGLHLLKDGDQLTIYHPSTMEEAWKGIIELEQHPLFTEHASGLWIHADQKGIERDVWAEYFFKAYPARLVLAKES